MFYNRIQMKKAALAMLKPRWKNAAFVGLCFTLPIFAFYAFFFLWWFKVMGLVKNGELSPVFAILQFLLVLILFVAICSIFAFALCKWNIQLAKSSDSSNPDAPPAPSFKDFFRFFTPISIGLYFWCLLKVFLWSLLMIPVSLIFIPLGSKNLMMTLGPAIIIFAILGAVLYTFVYLVVLGKMISYFMSFYALADNPELSVKESAKLSIEITKGFRENLFITMLSFFGWFLLGMITFGIALFWIVPYYSQVFANSWLFMKAEKTKLIQNPLKTEPKELV